MILTQQGVPKHPQQFALHEESPLRDGLLLPRHVPQASEGHTSLAREPFDCCGLIELDEHAAGDSGADDSPLEEEGRANHGETRRWREDDRRAIVGLGET